jgi:hypothetical protein
VRHVALSAVALAMGLAQGGCELVVGEDRWRVGATSPDSGEAGAGDAGLLLAEDVALEVAPETGPPSEAMAACLAAACVTTASACEASCASDKQTCMSTCGNDKACAHQCQMALMSCQNACAQVCSACIGAAACGDAKQCAMAGGP